MCGIELIDTWSSPHAPAVTLARHNRFLSGGSTEQAVSTIGTINADLDVNCKPNRRLSPG
jgi:hypothetical protein